MALEFSDLLDLLLEVLVRMTDSFDLDLSMQMARASSNIPILLLLCGGCWMMLLVIKLALLFILARLLPRLGATSSQSNLYQNKQTNNKKKPHTHTNSKLSLSGLKALRGRHLKSSEPPFISRQLLNRFLR